MERAWALTARTAIIKQACLHSCHVNSIMVEEEELVHDMALRDRVREELVHVDKEELQGDVIVEVGSESEGSEEEENDTSADEL